MRDAVARAWRGGRWFVESMMGDRAYAAYVAHHRTAHPGAPLPSEREFWRERYRDQDRDPSGRCC